MTERHLDSQNLINYSLYIWEEMIKFWWVLRASFLRNNFFFRKKYVKNSKKRLILAIFLNKDVQEKIQNVTQTASFAYILLEMIPQAYNQLKLGFLISFPDFPFLGPVAVNYHQKLEMCHNLNIVSLFPWRDFRPEGPQASSLADSKRKNGKNPRDYIIEIKFIYIT